MGENERIEGPALRSVELKELRNARSPIEKLKFLHSTCMCARAKRPHVFNERPATLSRPFLVTAETEIFTGEAPAGHKPRRVAVDFAGACRKRPVIYAVARRVRERPPQCGPLGDRRGEGPR